MQLFKVKQISTLIGSSLLHFMIGSGNTFGNLNTYMTSYLRKNGTKDANYGQSVWYIAVGVTTFTTLTILSGYIAKKIGTRFTCLIGTIILCGSVALTSVSLKHTFITVLLTFGFMQNVGSGLMYSTIIVNCMKWFPNNKGLVTGVITGSNACSSFLFTQIQTFYLNPNNVKPNTEGYFEDEDLLSQVPKLFLVLGIIYSSIGLIAICLIFNSEETEVNQNNNNPYGSRTNLILEDGNETISVISTGTPTYYSLRQALNTRYFYVLWITFALSTQSAYIIGSMIKAFAQSFIGDDHYLAIILSLSFIVNGVGGVFWGKIMDYLKFRDSICVINGLLSASLFSVIISSYYYKKILFAIWNFLLYFVAVGIFSCYLPEVVLKFGHLNATTIYGAIHTGPAIASLIFSPINEWLLNSFGWFTTFSTMGALNALSMIIIMASYGFRNI